MLVPSRQLYSTSKRSMSEEEDTGLSLFPATNMGTTYAFTTTAFSNRYLSALAMA